MLRRPSGRRGQETHDEISSLSVPEFASAPIFLSMHSAARKWFLTSGCLLVSASLWLTVVACSPSKTAVSLVASYTPVVSPVRPVGYNSHIASQSNPDTYVDLIQKGGATSLRDNVFWANVEPEKDSFNWSQPDKIVALAARHRLHVLLVIGNAPSWASGVRSVQRWQPPLAAAPYGVFAGQVAARYRVGGKFWKQHPRLTPYLLAGLELWNEENTEGSWGGKSPNPQLYAQMVRDAYAAIKRADPKMTVVLGGLAAIGGYDDAACTGRHSGEQDSDGWNGINYLQALYAYGIHGYFDAVGWHPYVFWNGATAAQMLRYNVCSSFSQIAYTPVSVRSMMIAHGDARKRVWLTEAGAPTCVVGATYQCVSPTQEAALAVRETQIWFGHKWCKWAGGFYWYDIRDDHLGAQNIESHFGAVSPSNIPEPVYAALRQAWR
jgi:hypothetical protein